MFLQDLVGLKKNSHFPRFEMSRRSCWGLVFEVLEMRVSLEGLDDGRIFGRGIWDCFGSSGV